LDRVGHDAILREPTRCFRGRANESEARAARASPRCERVRHRLEERIAFEAARIVHRLRPGAVHDDDDVRVDVDVELLPEDAERTEHAPWREVRKRPPLVAVAEWLEAGQTHGPPEP